MSERNGTKSPVDTDELYRRLRDQVHDQNSDLLAERSRTEVILPQREETQFQTPVSDK